MLIVLAGLPGTGKSAIAESVARVLPALVVSVDPIEAALRQAGIEATQPTGLAAYLVAEVVVERALAADLNVLVDAVNAVEPARQQWRALAGRRQVALRIIEVVCSDPLLHRQRLEQRRRDLPHLPEPTWQEVVRRRREYAPWSDDRLILDTVHALERNVESAIRYLSGHATHHPSRVLNARLMAD